MTRHARYVIIGAGAVSDYHHVPAIKLDPRAELAGACDADPALLERRKTEWGIEVVTNDPEALCADPRVDAVIIATPNFTQKSISEAAARPGISPASQRACQRSGTSTGMGSWTAFTAPAASLMSMEKQSPSSSFGSVRKA